MSEYYKDIKLLLIEDDPGDAKLFQVRLGSIKKIKFNISHAESLKKAKKMLAKETYSVILLDLSLSDSIGFDTFYEVKSIAKNIPIIILSGNDNEDLAIKTVREGAQDYLFKQDAKSSLLLKVIEYSIHRQELLSKILKQALNDKLTDLYNLRGFMEMAQQRLVECKRNKTNAGLFFIDLNDLKLINDSFGHQYGDEAIKETGNLIKIVFRESDIKSRIGGDEFIILAADIKDDFEKSIRDRINAILELLNSRQDMIYSLSYSIGFSIHQHNDKINIEELIKKADHEMYKEKKKYHGLESFH